MSMGASNVPGTAVDLFIDAILVNFHTIQRGCPHQLQLLGEESGA